MNFRRDESGQTLVLTALCLTFFMGFMALAIDVGVLFESRRQLQIAADAAATAAALRYIYLYDGNNGNQSAEITAADSAGTAAGQQNLSGANVSVSVNANANSPSAHKGCVATTCYFEAVASQQSPAIFFSTFFNLWRGQSASPFTVAARAVAGTPNASSFCIFLTDPSGSVYSAHGKYLVNAPNCGVYVNSTSASAMTGKGAAGSVDVTEVAAVGSTSGYTVNFPSTTVVQGGVTPDTIPFSWITTPVPSGCVAWPGTSTVNPGCYSGNITIGGTVTLNPGLYIFTGNLDIKNATVSGTGVTLDMNSGSLTLEPGTGTVTLSAPTSGDGTGGTGINGVVLYQPSTNANGLSLQAGNTDMNLTGFIYAPAATVSVQDHGGSTSVSGLVVDSITSGPSPINVTGYTPGTSSLKVIALVE